MLKRYDLPLPSDYSPEISVLVAALQDGTREWRSHLGTPTVEAIAYQPYRDGYSIGGLVLHMIDVEIHWFEDVVAGLGRKEEELKLLLSEETDQASNVWPVPPAQPWEWYVELHDQFRSRVLSSLIGQDPDRIITRGNSYECSVSWIVAHVVEHDSYHGGQAVLLNEMWKNRNR